MRIIILITLIESSALMLWMIYWYYRRNRTPVRTGLVHPPLGSTNNNPNLDTFSTPLKSAHWSFINEWQVERQPDDRRPMSGSVHVIEGTALPARRAFARQSHQLMFKKWSKERHD